MLLFLDFLQRGRIAEAEAEFEKLLGGGHVKLAMADLSKLDKGDEADVKFAELICGRHYKGLISLLIYDENFIAGFYLFIVPQEITYSLFSQLFSLGRPFLLCNSFLA